MFYILDENNKPKKATLQECNDWMVKDETRRFIKQETYWPWFISTVFLGIDHKMPPADNEYDEPVLFETMVFRGKSMSGVRQRRYTSYEDAVAGHQDMAAKYFLLRNLGFCVAGLVVVAIVMMAALAVIL